jgi:hypothetical protein
MEQIKHPQIEITHCFVGLYLADRDKSRKSQRLLWSIKIFQSTFEGTEPFTTEIVVPSNSDFRSLKIERLFFSLRVHLPAPSHRNRDLPSISRFYKYMLCSILSLNSKLADSPHLFTVILMAHLESIARANPNKSWRILFLTSMFSARISQVSLFDPMLIHRFVDATFLNIVWSTNQSKSCGEVVDRQISSHQSWFLTKFDDIQISTFSLYPDQTDDQWQMKCQYQSNGHCSDNMTQARVCRENTQATTWSFLSMLSGSSWTRVPRSCRLNSSSLGQYTFVRIVLLDEGLSWSIDEPPRDYEITEHRTKQAGGFWMRSGCSNFSIHYLTRIPLL